MRFITLLPYKWIWVLIATVLVIASMRLWQAMPLMPDEIAIRVQVGRFIQDNGVAQGLYALCANRIQNVPWIFIPSALLLSLGDMHLSPIDLRYVAGGVLLACIFMAMATAYRNANASAMLWLPAAFIGVAGSTLVFFRFEVFLIAHLCVCMVALQALKQNSPAWLRKCICAVLLLTLLTMAYVHPQALLFVPLTAYLCYRLIYGADVKFIKLASCVGIFGGIAVTTHLFFKLSCEGYKQIELFWTEMVFDLRRLWSAEWFDILSEKFRLFSTSLQYNEAYTINYLPGIPKDMLASADVLNAGIAISMLMVMVTGIGLGVVVAYHVIVNGVMRRPTRTAFNLDAGLTFAFIFFPTLFYWLYDGHLYFYRSIILNLLFVIAVVIGLSEIKYKHINILTALLGISLCITCWASIDANKKYFYKLIQTYEGPSTSLKRDWEHAPEHFNEFAKRCQIDLAQGGGIVDDITYEAVKQYSHIYQITYLGLQMSLTNVKADTVIKLLKPNYVLARCTEMEAGGLGWPADLQEGDICCKRYNSASKP